MIISPRPAKLRVPLADHPEDGPTAEALSRLHCGTFRVRRGSYAGSMSLPQRLRHPSFRGDQFGDSCQTIEMANELICQFFVPYGFHFRRIA